MFVDLSVSCFFISVIFMHFFMLWCGLLQLDTAVLQYQNQKLIQKLEAQKVERIVLENKYCQLKEKQQPYDGTLAVVNEAWEQVVYLCIASTFP